LKTPRQRGAFEAAVQFRRSLQLRPTSTPAVWRYLHDPIRRSGFALATDIPDGANEI
jgi:hypothetical protein